MHERHSASCPLPYRPSTGNCRLVAEPPGSAPLASTRPAKPSAPPGPCAIMICGTASTELPAAYRSIARRKIDPPESLRSIRPLIRGMSAPPVAILPTMRGISPVRAAISTRDSDTSRAPLPPRNSARGVSSEYPSGSNRKRISASSALPRVSACKAFAILRVSGAMSVPSPVRASDSTVATNPRPSRNPLPSRLPSSWSRSPPSLARNCPSAVSTAASTCGVSTPRAASEYFAVVSRSRICARTVPMMAEAVLPA